MVFQDYALWPQVSVLSNVVYALERLRLPRQDARRRALAMLDRVGLARLANRRPPELSGGEQQMLSISRALMGRPKLLLLDEPSLGLSPLLVTQIFRIIRRINEEQGVAILLVEQNAHMALRTAQFGYVLEVGRIVLADDCAKLMQTDAIKEFYLGQKETGVRGQRRWKPNGAASASMS